MKKNINEPLTTYLAGLWTKEKLDHVVKDLAEKYDINNDKERTVVHEGLNSMHDSLSHEVLNAVFKYADVKGVVFSDGWIR